MSDHKMTAQMTDKKFDKLADKLHRCNTGNRGMFRVAQVGTLNF